uniref:Uncharacterized protein n=1 Tax=Anguilla anguilla TaxID=7936 RepID=A0A0E9XCJ6_ANGAN
MYSLRHAAVLGEEAAGKHSETSEGRPPLQHPNYASSRNKNVPRCYCSYKTIALNELTSASPLAWKCTFNAPRPNCGTASESRKDLASSALAR